MRLVVCIGLVVWLGLVGWIQAWGMEEPVPQTTAYLPTIYSLPRPTAVPLPPPLPAPVAVSSATPLNFEQVRQNLASQGLLLGTNKIGFHVGMGGNMTDLDSWMRDLDAAGVPIFLKSADNAEPIYHAQELMRQSGVPHVLVYRRTGAEYDVPNYNLPPQQAAAEHWARHTAVFPPELDKNLVWLETMNEVDKNRTTWLAIFAYETAQLALRDGYKWAAFGWASGEPEPYHWEGHAMLRFLELVGQHPTRLAISLHEYSYATENIRNIYPYLVGRFQFLFQTCDKYGLPRPTVLITEWGWDAEDVPEPTAALEDIRWAARLYSAYPQVQGAAIWYLGGGYGEIANQAQKLILPVRDYSQRHYFAITPGRGRIEMGLFADGTSDWGLEANDE